MLQRFIWLRFISALAFLLPAVWPAISLPLTTTPVASVNDQPPWSTPYTSSQHRYLEAEAKARLANKALSGGSFATPNMSRYDVRSYDLALELDPDTEMLSGISTLTAEVLADSLVSLDMHLQATLAVSQVTNGGQAAPFTRDGDLLTVILNRPFNRGEHVVVAVNYHGNPAGDFFVWDTHDGAPLIWTLSEPYGARHWWACKDLSSDKADSVALHVTVPENLVVASNGLLDETTVLSPGLKTYHWTERYPIATYLVSLAIHPYEVFTYGYYPINGGVMPVVSYVIPEEWADAQTGYLKTLDMLTAFAQGFGEYPFVKEKYGHAQFPWSGGMEHQTLTSIYIGYYGANLMAHELGHQWFGDMVTCHDFHHIWLNEGFATWTEARWKEVSEGISAYHAAMSDARWTGNGTIYVEDTTNLWDVFDQNLCYDKASWIPHMLRHLMGDDVFFPALRTYLDTYRFSTATTEQFQAVMEAESGLDLEVFFQQWIYGEACPLYRYSWADEEVSGATRLGLRVDQVQAGVGPFNMPLDVRVTTLDGVENFVIQNDQTSQWYSLHVNGVVLTVEIDPDNWVLCEKELQWRTHTPSRPTTGPRLVGNAPNPFNPATEILFVLERESNVRLSVYDMAGRRVRELVSGVFSDGEHKVRWDGTDAAGQALASGTYYARLSSASQHQVKPMALLR